MHGFVYEVLYLIHSNIHILRFKVAYVKYISLQSNTDPIDSVSAQTISSAVDGEP